MHKQFFFFPLLFFINELRYTQTILKNAEKGKQRNKLKTSYKMVDLSLTISTILNSLNAPVKRQNYQKEEI